MALLLRQNIKNSLNFLTYNNSQGALEKNLKIFFKQLTMVTDNMVQSEFGFVDREIGKNSDFVEQYYKLFDGLADVRISLRLHNFVNGNRPNEVLIPWEDVRKLLHNHEYLELLEGIKYKIRRIPKTDDDKKNVKTSLYGAYSFKNDSMGINFRYVARLESPQIVLFEPDIHDWYGTGGYNCPNDIEIASALGISIVTIKAPEKIKVKEGKSHITHYSNNIKVKEWDLPRIEMYFASEEDEVRKLKEK